MNVIDFSPVLNPLIQLAGLVLMGLVSWGAAKAAAYFHVQSQSELLSRVVGIVDRGISYAEQVVTTKVSGADKLTVQNAIAAEAANYVIQKAPETLAGLGMTKEHVADLVLARLPKAA